MLRLIFMTCHPVLSRDARVALTLRLLGGLSTPEIARAFLVSEGTVAQRIVRAKRTLSEARVPFEVPGRDELGDRLSAVLEVIYLVFNEGYAATGGEHWIRPPLCEDALRLGRILAGLMPGEPEVHGLLALMELQASRLRARVGPGGEPVLLADQDRARWDRLLVQRGLAALGRAEKLAGALGPYTLQAAIAACHARARSVEDTDWPRIVALYDGLAALTGVAGRRAQPRGGGGDGLRARRRGWSSSTRWPTTARCATTTCCRASAATCSSGSGATPRRGASSCARPSCAPTSASASCSWRGPKRCSAMIRTAGAREGPGDGRFDPSPPRDLEARPRALPDDRPPAQPRPDRQRRGALPGPLGAGRDRAAGAVAGRGPRPGRAVFLIRMYSLFHDLTHNSLFRSRAANGRWGHLLGFLLFTPYRWWQRQHSLHHANTGNLDSAGPGEIYTMTLAEYQRASRLRPARLPRCTATRC